MSESEVQMLLTHVRTLARNLSLLSDDLRRVERLLEEVRRRG